jgi:flagellar assembly protein FliH
MTGSSNHSKAKARFIPGEELQEAQVRIWRFGDVALGGLGEGMLPPLAQDNEDFRPLLEDPPAAPTAIEEPQTEPPAQSEAEAEEPAPPPPPPEPAISEEELQQMLEQARQEGFAQGLQQGEQQAAEQWQQRLQEYQDNQGREIGQRLAEVLRQAQEGIRGLQQQVAPDLLQLACDIARQVVRQELRTNPQALMPVVREALDMLGAETRPATVRLHPDDWQHLEAHVRAAWPNPKIEWLQDASVPVGDCWVESQGAQVDGSLEKRWQRAVAALGLVSTWYEGASHG